MVTDMCRSVPLAEIEFRFRPVSIALSVPLPFSPPVTV